MVDNVNLWNCTSLRYILNYAHFTDTTAFLFNIYTVVAMLVQVQFLFFKFFAVVVVVALIKVPDVDSAT